MIDEKEYLFSAYFEISKKCSSIQSEEIYKYLKSTFLKSGRKNIYQKLIKNFQIQNFDLQDFLNIIRLHKTQNKLITLPWFENLAKLISCKFPIYLITNGNFIQQKNKIDNLILPQNTYFRKIIFADQYEPKPSSISFQILDKEFQLKDPIYIGDSDIDMHFAYKSRIEFINVKDLVNCF